MNNSYKNKVLLLILLILPLTITGQFYFGKNKINYKQFEWLVLESKNFDIYYYKGEEKIAAMARDIAKQAYREYEIKFNITIDRKIPLVIYSNPIHFQQTNIIQSRIPEGVGGFFEYMKGRVVLPFTGKRSDFQHVIRHEIVHVFSHYKIAATARKIGLYESSGFPLWFMEGLAEYWSIGYDKESEMYIKDAILHDYLVPLYSFRLYFAGFLLYKEGQAFIKYYEEHYGADRIRKLMTDYWKYNSFEEAISDISGKDFKRIVEDWQLHLKKKYALHIHNQNITHTDNRRFNDRDIQVSPAIYNSDSAKNIIYMSNKWGYENIILKKLEENTEEVLVRSRQIPKYESLHLLQTRLTVNNQGELAFVAKAGKNDVIWLYNIKNRKKTHQIGANEIVTIANPMWSKNGEMLAFSAQDTTGWSDIYIWKRKQNQIYRITRDIYGDSSPSFSPNNQYLVFASDRKNEEYNTKNDLYICRIKNGDIYQLTDSKTNQYKPFWHPDKMNTIYFLSDSTERGNLWCLEFSDSLITNNKKVKYKQLSNFYTGIHSYSPNDKKGLVLGKFGNYNYHLDNYTPDSSYSSYNDSMQYFQKKDSISQELKLDKKKVKSYKLKYSLDLAQTTVAYDPLFGMLGGAQLSISDMLGNRYYNFLLANTSQTTSEIMDYWNIAATMIDLKQRCDRSLSLFHFANDYYSPYEGFYFERTIGTRAGINYPINTYDRVELSTSLWHSTKDFYGYKEKRFLISNFISYVHDNSMWTYTGPIDGWRMRLTFGPSYNFKSSQISNFIFLGDFRYYLRLSKSIAFAHRTMSIFNSGDDVRRFYIGGSWYMRGYDYTDIYGKKFIMFNNELRLPFAQSLTLNFGNTTLGLFPIRSAVFFDIGNAWDREFPGFIGSFGIGLRGSLMSQLVLRMDIGKRTDFNSIQKDLFVKFFFGWSY
ncbi:MAG: hypothetical protein K9M80_05780 [Candidatus Marinimicrobia bacterium]|nr:hypothetical protein [Candidatus Neomarinimicrobiota bacterium]